MYLQSQFPKCKQNYVAVLPSVVHFKDEFNCLTNFPLVPKNIIKIAFVVMRCFCCFFFRLFFEVLHAFIENLVCELKSSHRTITFQLNLFCTKQLV